MYRQGSQQAEGCLNLGGTNAYPCRVGSKRVSKWLDSSVDVRLWFILLREHIRFVGQAPKTPMILFMTIRAGTFISAVKVSSVLFKQDDPAHYRNCGVFIWLCDISEPEGRRSQNTKQCHEKAAISVMREAYRSCCFFSESVACGYRPFHSYRCRGGRS